MSRLTLLFLMLLVVLAPLPLGSNREWSWTLCALWASGLTLFWVVARGWRTREAASFIHPGITILFLLGCLWVLVQVFPAVPESWKHPLWFLSAQALGTELPGSISLSAEDSMTALMKLLSCAVVFYLSFQLARNRSRCHAMLGWIVFAGLVYGIFGLVMFWTETTPQWIFGERILAHDLRSSFINRNHFASWQGLTLLCAMAWLQLKLTSNSHRPYDLPAGHLAAFESFFLRAWLPLTTILLMVTALVLTHSRGGFVATLIATMGLMLLIDARTRSSRAMGRLIVISALAVASLAFYLTSEVLLDRIDRTDITNEERLVVFENVQNGIGENPILGFGYGTFADAFRLYDRVEAPVHYDRAHNTWLEYFFELGIPAALALILSIGGLVLTCLNGVRRRHRDWVLPAVGVAATILAAVHALVDFSFQIPAVMLLYACIMGLACAQSYSSVRPVTHRRLSMENL